MIELEDYEDKVKEYERVNPKCKVVQDKRLVQYKATCQMKIEGDGTENHSKS